MVQVVLQCPAHPPPTMTLSGVCSGTAPTDGSLAFGATAAGSCHVDVSFEGGTRFSTDVEFTGQWLACGSDPHGCGERITPAGYNGPYVAGPLTDVLVDAGCVDAAIGDAASE
jgi:hypothetical protein